MGNICVCYLCLSNWSKTEANFAKRKSFSEPPFLGVALAPHPGREGAGGVRQSPPRAEGGGVREREDMQGGEREDMQGGANGGRREEGTASGAPCGRQVGPIPRQGITPAGRVGATSGGCGR